MNIAVFIKKTTFHEGFGGLETQNKTLCEGLASRGHKITIFSPKYEFSDDFMESGGVKYVFVDSSYRSLAGFAHLDKNNWVNKSVEVFKTAAEKEPFDAVLAQSSSGLGVIRHKEDLGVPVISISHGTTVGEYKTLLQSIKSLKDVLMLAPNTAYLLLNFFSRQRKFVLDSDLVVAVSNVVKQALVEETFIPEERVVVIHNGVDGEKIKQKETSAKTGNLQLLFSSQVIKSKGIGDLLKALTSEELKTVSLEVLAGGGDLDYYKKVSEKLGLSNRVNFLGKLPYEDYLSRISESDVFVMPSKRKEGFPMAVPEAAFAKLPTIGSDSGGTPEAIDNGKTGFVFESGDVGALVSLISKFIKEPELVEQMGNAAYAKAKQEFSLGAMLNKYEEIMNEVVS